MGNLDYPLAYGWHKIQGKYSEDLARKILNFEKIQKLKSYSMIYSQQLDYKLYLLQTKNFT